MVAPTFSNDALTGQRAELEYAKILMVLGEYEKALDKLKFLIPFSGHITVIELQQEPIWDPLRDMEEFKALINNPVYQVKL